MLRAGADAEGAGAGDAEAGAPGAWARLPLSRAPLGFPAARLAITRARRGAETPTEMLAGPPAPLSAKCHRNTAEFWSESV